ncbi:MAG: zinc metallopeptidase [Deltaproteobacteria bacterium]|nr:MAG: zinc metallopeptidase [Deltaproteobacteria bacterium]
MWWDAGYWLVVGVGALLSIGAQIWVQRAVGRWSRVPTRGGLSGREVAELILRVRGVQGVRIEPVAGFLSDHYDPSRRVLRLSPDVYEGRSVAAAGIAAHEVGHAIQDADGYVPMRLRQKMVPVANVGTQLGLWLTVIGLVLGALQLATVGVVLFGGFVAFTLVTLPVEFDASLRAHRALADSGYFTPEELAGVRQVLTAAAATYLAAAASALLQLLYWASLLSGRRDE